MAESKPAVANPQTSRILNAIENTILVVMLAVMLSLAITQIVLRNFFDSGIIWADGFLQVMVLWIGLVGAVAASRDDRQITVDALTRFISPQLKPWIRVITDFFTAGLAGVLAWHAGRLVIDERSGGMTSFGAVPLWLCEVILPVAFGLIALRYLLFGIEHLRQGLSMKDAS